MRNTSGGDFGVVDFFFFQAEDGIRDIGVTGVQTCALPISLLCLSKLCRLLITLESVQNSQSVDEHGSVLQHPDSTKPTRSEERRVGKECRSRWSPYH